MLGRRLRQSLLGLALAVAGAAALAGCGGSDDSSSSASRPTTADASSFPAGRGQTVAELVRGLPEGPVLAPTVSVVGKGPNRIGFGLFKPDRTQVTDAQVVLYTATAQGTGVRGPYPARAESLAVKPQFLARTTSQDPDAAKSVYVADVPLPRDGQQALVALARVDGRLVASGAVDVGDWEGRPTQPPKVGERAIAVDTPTRTSVGGDLSKIDTRVPPDSQHDVNFADVLGKRPVVLTFATPQLCQSRVCGPVVDITEQAKSQWSSRGVDFVHMEIYADNKLDKPPRFRPQVVRWRLPSEPWTFVIGKDGRVKARFEGAFSAAELDSALRRAVAND
jgi:hypothetical protein